MILSLRGPLRKLAFAGVSLLLAGLYLSLAARYYRASRLAEVFELDSLERASRLVPSNADYHDRLGRYLFVVQQDANGGMEHYRVATSLNPYEARYWLDLAAAYQVAGDRDQTRKALEHALQADPRTPDIAWEVGNFYLAEGDQATALPLFRIVLEKNWWDVERTLDLCWRATRDPDRILDQVVPPDPRLYLSFLAMLSAQQQSAAEARVWTRLMHLQKPFATKDAFPYLQSLLNRKDVAAAQAAWEQLLTRNSLRAYLTPGSAVVNGGFEQEVLNGGFDWRNAAVPGVSLALDTGEAHSGSRSLRLTFDDTAAADEGLVQFIPVEPGAEYELSAWVKADGLLAASRPRLAVEDAYSQVRYAMTDEALVSSPWSELRMRFKLPSDVRLLALRIVRSPSAGTVRGRLWLDDVRLEKIQP